MDKETAKKILDEISFLKNKTNDQVALSIYCLSGILVDIGRELNRIVDAEDICPECGERRPDDYRVKANMKCGLCAYGGK